MAIHPKFRPWKSRGLPVFQLYACNCDPRRTIPEIYPFFLVGKPSLELSLEAIHLAGSYQLFTGHRLMIHGLTKVNTC